MIASLAPSTTTVTLVTALQIIDDVSNALSDMREIDPDFVGEVNDAGDGPRVSTAGAAADVDDVSIAVQQIAAVYNFQKKRVPWQDIAWGSAVVNDTVLIGCFVGRTRGFDACTSTPGLTCRWCGGCIGRAHQVEAASMVSALASPSVQKSILTAVDARGRPCQPLVVMASMVDKAPNLGGLARTCEVFRAQCMTVNDLRIKVRSWCWHWSHAVRGSRIHAAV